jgi:hypothetical protein
MFRTFTLTLASIAAMGLAGTTMTPAAAGGYSGGHGGYGGYCPPKPPPGTTINIHKPVRIYKPVRINNSVRINKNIVINKPIRINKTIIINKGGVDAEAVARAAASARSDSTAIAVASGGSAIVDVAAPATGDFGSVAVDMPCVDQWAIVVKAIHAECVSRTGTRHPATRMRPETWVDSTMNAEIYRCLAGSHLYVKIGDVVDSREGMAGVYEGAQVLECAPGQALRHYRDGTVKCAVAERLTDCVERRNMRRYGIGDLFFSYRAKVCARVSWSASQSRAASASASATATEVEVEGSFSGGVGE